MFIRPKGVSPKAHQAEESKGAKKVDIVSEKDFIITGSVHSSMQSEKVTPISTSTLITHQAFLTTYNLLTQQAGRLEHKPTCQYSNFFSPRGITCLPDNKFVIAEGSKLYFYSSETLKLLKELPLPFKPEELSGCKSLIVDCMQLSSDKQMLIVQTIRDGNKADAFFMNTQTLNFERRSLLAYHEAITWLGEGQFIITKTNSDKVAIHSLHSEKTIPCEIQDANFIHKIFTWPDHPSTWIIAIGGSFEQALYLYHVNKTADKWTTKRGEKLGIIDRYDILSSRIAESANSLFFIDQPSAVITKEFDLNRMELRELQLKDKFEHLTPKCAFPDGRMCILSMDKVKKNYCMTIVESNGCQTKKQEKTAAQSEEHDDDIPDLPKYIKPFGSKR